MDEQSQANVETAKKYLHAIETFAPVQEMAVCLDSEIIQREFPNRLNPNGGTSDYARMTSRYDGSRQVLTAQSYDIQNVIASGDNVALEVDWTGTLAIPLGKLKPGDVMRAHFGVFFKFRGGKIISQHNYDCFEPW